MVRSWIGLAGLVVVCGVAVPAPAEAGLVVDHIVARGDPRVTEQVLAARMRLHPGDPVDFAVLSAAERRLVESGLFTNVRVFIDLPRPEAVQRMYLDDLNYPVDVVVEAIGKHSWFVFPIAGFGSGDWAGGLVYADQNFLGRDVQILGAAQIGKTRSYAVAGFRDPMVVGAALTYSFGGLYRREQVPFFANHALFMKVPTIVAGGEGQIGWVLSPSTRAFIGLSARHQTVGSVEGLAPGATPQPYNPLSGRIFLLQFQLQYDNTRAPEGLRDGVVLFLKNEVSDRYWGSDFDYSKFEVRAELYGHFGWNYPSLLLNAVLDYPTSDQGRPITELLHLGGANLRGYLANEFHGDTLLSVQAEDQAVVLHSRLPWTQVKVNIAAAVFVDAGILLERHPGGTAVPPPGIPPPPVRSKLADIHASFGAGARIILPGVSIPAFKVDVGYGIDVRSVAVTVSIAGG
jgi:outer membrane protein assembly factor BamA